MQSRFLSFRSTNRLIKTFLTDHAITIGVNGLNSFICLWCNTTIVTSVASKLCACARAHSFQRLRTRINLLHAHIMMNQKKCAHLKNFCAHWLQKIRGNLDSNHRKNYAFPPNVTVYNETKVQFGCGHLHTAPEVEDHWYQCCHFWYSNMSSDVMFSGNFLMSDALATNLMLTGLMFFSTYPLILGRK